MRGPSQSAAEGIADHCASQRPVGHRLHPVRARETERRRSGAVRLRERWSSERSSRPARAAPLRRTAEHRRAPTALLAHSSAHPLLAHCSPTARPPLAHCSIAGGKPRPERIPSRTDADGRSRRSASHTTPHMLGGASSESWPLVPRAPTISSTPQQLQTGVLGLTPEAARGSLKGPRRRRGASSRPNRRTRRKRRRGGLLARRGCRC